MAQNNAINNASSQLTVDPGASGDSFVQFDINTTGEFRIGVDDDASDAFKVSQGSALGTNDTFVMTAAGELTKPLQPAFYARVGTTLTNVTGDGTTYAIILNTEIYDQGSDYDTTTGLFTAPVTGRYYFCGIFGMEGFTSSHTLGFGQLVGSNRTMLLWQNSPTAQDTSGGAGLSINYSCHLDMDAADTAILNVTISNGTKVVDVRGGNLTAFQGQLVA